MTGQRHIPAEDAVLLENYRQTHNTVYVGELFKRYKHLVYGVCIKYLKDPEESKDAVMQVFERLISKLKNYEVENFPAWLHVTTRNHCLMALRSSKNYNNEEILMEFEGFMHPYKEGEEDIGKDLSMLRTGVNELPEEQKACITLFYLEKKSYREIVEITGYQLKKVKSYLQNGRRNLKIYLENSREKR